MTILTITYTYLGYSSFKDYAMGQTNDYLDNSEKLNNKIVNNGSIIVNYLYSNRKRNQK